MNEKTRAQIEAMKNQTVGVEVEMNNITREKAAKKAAEFFGTGRYENTAGRNGYYTWSAWDAQGREWKFQRDVSIDVATLLYRPIITLVVCHRINRYNDMRTEKGKGSRTLIFCTEPCPETIIKNMVIISKYEVEYNNKKEEDIFNKQ